jgi:hypothetical protein
MATSPISTRRCGGNALAATLATTLAVTTPALASDPRVHRAGDDACAIAFMPQGGECGADQGGLGLASGSEGLAGLACGLV